MNDKVIEVESLSKQYRLGKVGSKTLRHDVNRWLHKLMGKENPYAKIGEENNRSIKGTSDYVWALKDINFEVKKGEVLGIIGKNGAGKSTLLKILSKITTPTTGQIKVKGRVASLLEVGTGFHPELSGKDNIFLNGAILGMSKSDIQKKFDEIVEFSGVERYIDTPVKRYSSGMYVRLAFAVAAHLEPEILIVDEVLAVGDAEFQRKCLGKMKDVSEEEGRTVLFVSHNISAVSTLCTHAICLANGKIAFNGGTTEAINLYFDDSKTKTGEYKAIPNPQKPSFTYINVITSELNYIHTNGKKLQLDFEVFMPDHIQGMAVSFQIFNKNEKAVIYSYIFDVDVPLLRKKGVNKLKCFLPNCKLYHGKYYIKAHLAESKSKIKFDEIDKICEFEVMMLNKNIEWGWPNDVCMYTEDFYWEFI